MHFSAFHKKPTNFVLHSAWIVFNIKVLFLYTLTLPYWSSKYSNDHVVKMPPMVRSIVLKTRVHGPFLPQIESHFQISKNPSILTLLIECKASFYASCHLLAKWLEKHWAYIYLFACLQYAPIPTIHFLHAQVRLKMCDWINSRGISRYNGVDTHYTTASSFFIHFYHWLFPCLYFEKLDRWNPNKVMKHQWRDWQTFKLCSWFGGRGQSVHTIEECSWKLRESHLELTSGCWAWYICISTWSLLNL